MNSLTYETASEIPKLIWQTYKDYPPANSKPLIDSWTNLNPEYTWMYMDDSRCSRFIKENFSTEFSSMYNSLPLGVMKADVWRVAVVYAYGGVYVDLDCRCIKPISTWLHPEDELIIGVERENGNLLNYAFAAKPRHPALLSVLNNFVELFNSPQFMDTNEKTPVQNFGQHGFSDGILRHYGINYTSPDKEKGGNTNFFNEIYKVKEEKTKFILRQDNVFSHSINNNTCILHEVASIKWRNYDSWRKQEKNFMESK